MDISLSDAKKIIDVALKTQEKNNYKPMAIAVLASAGSLRACECQDGKSQTGTLFYTSNELAV